MKLTFTFAYRREGEQMKERATSVHIGAVGK